MTRVFPVPAPATTNRDPESCVTASRWASLSPDSTSKGFSATVNGQYETSAGTNRAEASATALPSSLLIAASASIRPLRTAVTVPVILILSPAETDFRNRISILAVTARKSLNQSAYAIASSMRVVRIPPCTMPGQPSWLSLGTNKASACPSEPREKTR